MKIEEPESPMEKIEESRSSEMEQRRSSGYVPGEKSGKWSEEEHMKYIVFIDYNKEKMRSRVKRRSNKFYEEMARFIVTRNSLQCRSHHQKLEEKYNHVNKIIGLYKPFYAKNIYKLHLEQLDFFTRKEASDNVTRCSISEKHVVDAAVQTDIKDLNLEFKVINPELVVIQKRHPLTNGVVHVPPHFYSYPAYPLEMAAYSQNASFSLPNYKYWPSYPHLSI